MFWIGLVLKCFGVLAIGGLISGAVGAGWASNTAILLMIVALVWVIRTDLAKRPLD